MRPQRPKNPKWALPWIELRHGKHNEERHALFGFPGLKPSRENERGTSRWFCQAGQVSGACTDGSNSPTVRLNRDGIVTRFAQRRQVAIAVGPVKAHLDSKWSLFEIWAFPAREHGRSRYRARSASCPLRGLAPDRFPSFLAPLG
ncbi:hypothetical protein SDC9_100345 [bioreactor metagenome]|uniref:Uncharacterized protein n=1 Tax=bioreactor metagenome TaxID=1076179 RepID=A0A645AKL4_9ZZZZ